MKNCLHLHFSIILVVIVLLALLSIIIKHPYDYTQLAVFTLEQKLQDIFNVHLQILGEDQF